MYLLAFFIFLISETFSTTMFQLPGSAYTLCKAVACLLLIIKVFRFDEFSRRTFFIFVLLILEAILVYVNSGYMEVFFWVLFVMGAKNVSFKKILKVYLIVTISIVLLAFCASMLQVIENLQYTRGDGKRVRNSFGAIYTTDFASHIFRFGLSKSECTVLADVCLSDCSLFYSWSGCGSIGLLVLQYTSGYGLSVSYADLFLLHQPEICCKR